MTWHAPSLNVQTSISATPPKADEAKILEALAYLFEPGEVVELRAIARSGPKRTAAGYFNSEHWPALAKAAAKLNNQGAAVYVTLNPVDRQLLSRYHNRVETDAKATTTDTQIVYRRWLPIDLDPVRPSDTSATHEQLERAVAKAEAVQRFLTEQRWPPCAVAHSGNGMHLLYPIELLNDEDSKKLVEGVLKVLAARFDDKAVKVDRSVFNAARIWKLYGTVANKGDHTDAAPWRLASLSAQHMPPRIVVPREKLLALTASTETLHVPGGSDSGKPLGAPSFDLESFMQRHGIENTRDWYEGSERFKLAMCPFNGEHRNGEAAIFRRAGGALAFKCFHNSCSDKDWRAVRKHYDEPHMGQRPEGWPKVGEVKVFGESENLAATAILKAATPAALLRPVSVRDVLTNPSPAPECVWDGYLPRGVVSLWGAHGGTGKSTMALMLCVATVIGRELFGVPTLRSKVLFVSLEDNEHVVRHRLAHICREWGVEPSAFDGELLIVDGCEHPELFTAETRADGSVTPTYVELQQISAESHVGLVVVDNASDAFGADEIQRRQVRAFMRAMGTIAKQSHCAVVVLAHVDKATSKVTRGLNNEGYSGSTAWHNSARSRLFMSRDDTTGLLTLEHQKANLTLRREKITLDWPNGGLPRLASDQPSRSAGTDHERGRSDDAAAVVLLRLLAEYEGRGHYASPALRATTGVYKLLESDPSFKRLKLRREDVIRIVHQCHRARWIECLDYKSKNSNKWAQRWAITKEGRLYAGLEAPASPTSPTLNEDDHGDVGGNVGSPTSPTYVGGVGGKSAAGLAP